MHPECECPYLNGQVVAVAVVDLYKIQINILR
jgi:hypothetical protein